MIIPTAHFGEVEIDEAKILTFEDGRPASRKTRAFAILSNEEASR